MQQWLCHSLVHLYIAKQLSTHTGKLSLKQYSIDVAPASKLQKKLLFYPFKKHKKQPAKMTFS